MDRVAKSGMTKVENFGIFSTATFSIKKNKEYLYSLFAFAILSLFENQGSKSGLPLQYCAMNRRTLNLTGYRFTLVPD